MTGNRKKFVFFLNETITRLKTRKEKKNFIFLVSLMTIFFLDVCTFYILFEQGALHFHFALSLRNYRAKSLPHRLCMSL